MQLGPGNLRRSNKECREKSINNLIHQMKKHNDFSNKLKIYTT